MRNAVNLLPPEYLSQRRQEHSMRRIRSLMLVVIVLLLAVLVAIFAFVLTSSFQLSSLQQQNVQLEVQVQALAVYEQLAAETTQLRDKVQKVQLTDTAWLRQMSNIAAALPRSVWIESFNGAAVERNEQGLPIAISCELICNGTNYEDVAASIRALEESAALSAVCTTSNTTSSGSTIFALTVQLPLEQLN